MLAEIYTCNDTLAYIGAETGRLFLQIGHKLRAGHSFMVAWKVLHLCGDRELSAGLVACIYQRLHIGSRSVYGSCESGRAGADYKAFGVNLVHVSCCGLFVIYLRSLIVAPG